MISNAPPGPPHPGKPGLPAGPSQTPAGPRRISVEPLVVLQMDDAVQFQA